VIASRCEFTVQVAVPDDVDDLVDLMEEFYAESSFRLDRQWARASLLRLMAAAELGRIWLARSGGSAVGHVVLTVRYTMEHGGLSAYVDDLFVRPALRRNGIGRAMLDELFRECRARGCKSIQVEVGASNASALGLYATFGVLPHQDDRKLLSSTIVD
jgi:ribosomal protein S18 acetylase RimI-like enzyme